MEDVPVIMRLIEEARGIMRSCGNVNQWIGGYPSEETIVNDINNGHCYLCVEEGGEVIASFAFIPGPEPTYKEIYEGNWLDDKPIDTHRDNVIMRHVIDRYGFTYCGIIYLLNGDERLAYQLSKR